MKNTPGYTLRELTDGFPSKFLKLLRIERTTEVVQGGKAVQQTTEIPLEPILNAAKGLAASTAHAVLNANRKAGNRRFILVQLPQPTDGSQFRNIADLAKDRVRRVIKKLNEEDATTRRADEDRGFKVLKLQSSNFKPWRAAVPKDAEQLANQLEMHVEHIEQGRSQEDILFEILLKSGFPLTTRIESLMLAGKTVYSVADGAMLICLEKELTQDVVKEIAARKPERVVCLDQGFAGNDQLKTNAAQTMKAKGVTSFRTV